MSFLDRLLGVEERGADYTVNPNDLFGRGLEELGRGTAAGIAVNDETPFQIPTAYRCITLLSDVISGQSCGAFVKREDVYTPVETPGFLKFNAGIFTKSQIVGGMVAAISTSGNSYTATMRLGSGEVIWLDPLDPQRIEPYRLDNIKYFRVDGKELDSEGNRFTTFDILHVPGLVLPGNLKGLSPTEALRDSIALAVAANRYGAGFFGNSALPGAIVEVEGEMSPAAKRAARREWDAIHRGSGNGKKIGFLTQGAKFKPITIPPNEAQFLQTREFQVPEIARIYGVPPSLLGHSDGPDMGQSIQDKGHQFNQYTLGGWFNRIQEAFTWLHHSEGADKDVEIRFDRESLEQGNRTEFVENNVKLIREGVLTINEVRAKLGKAPVEWGDEPISVQVQEDVDDGLTEKVTEDE